MTGRRNHAVGALAPAEPRIFLDAVDGNLCGASENRKYRAVFQKIDCVITPLAGGDHAAVKAENAVELAPAEGHHTRGGGRSKLAPAPRARFDFADIHPAPPLSCSLHDRAGRRRRQGPLAQQMAGPRSTKTRRQAPGAHGYGTWLRHMAAAQLRHLRRPESRLR